ncbi:MAG TPA: M56 family metallopeptidase [Gemmatimonadaceae bacterium]|nr:M56 family metallopeptidase [Gemmatimonadaceae bacterium]
MMTSWMLYTVLVAASVSVAALVLDRLAALGGRPTRLIWAAALGASVLLPAAATLRSYLAARAAPVSLMPFTITVQAPAMIIRARAGWGVPWDLVALIAWGLLTTFLLVRLARDVVALERRRRTWRDAQVDGMPVRLSLDTGPAVVGLRSMDVVLPEWILSLDASLRALVLRHEEEHRRARDPHLLFGAELLWALMPWNLPLWYQARRLRLAIEMDCDARVLRAHPSTERYGLLMLTIAQRRGVAPLLATMLSEPVTQLERRIIAMRTTTRRLARATLVGGAAVALGALAFACSLQSDNPVAPTPTSQPKALSAHQTYFEFQVERTAHPDSGTAAPRYPDMLRSSGVEGDVLVQFVVGTDGRADMATFKVLKTSHDLFTAAVRNSLATMHWVPADVGGHAVKQLVQMPFQFRLGGATMGTAVSPSPRKQLGPPVGYVESRAPQAGTANIVSVPVRRAGEPGRVTDNDTYFEYQVEQSVSPFPTNQAPRYPDVLRKANVEGEVLAQFVVDTNGVADMSTFKVLKSTHDLFTATVMSALPSMRFHPALVGGRKVKQFTQMPFQFSLTK